MPKKLAAVVPVLPVIFQFVAIFGCHSEAAVSYVNTCPSVGAVTDTGMFCIFSTLLAAKVPVTSPAIFKADKSVCFVASASLSKDKSRFIPSAFKA